MRASQDLGRLVIANFNKPSVQLDGIVVFWPNFSFKNTWWALDPKTYIATIRPGNSVDGIHVLYKGVFFRGEKYCAPMRSKQN